jgi:hypothetical protein
VRRACHGAWPGRHVGCARCVAAAPARAPFRPRYPTRRRSPHPTPRTSRASACIAGPSAATPGAAPPPLPLPPSPPLPLSSLLLLLLLLLPLVVAMPPRCCCWCCWCCWCCCCAAAARRRGAPTAAAGQPRAPRPRAEAALQPHQLLPPPAAAATSRAAPAASIGAKAGAPADLGADERGFWGAERRDECDGCLWALPRALELFNPRRGRAAVARGARAGGRPRKGRPGRPPSLHRCPNPKRAPGSPASSLGRLCRRQAPWALGPPHVGGWDRAGRPTSVHPGWGSARPGTAQRALRHAPRQ